MTNHIDPDPTTPQGWTCAFCGAQPGEHCLTRSGEPAPARPHADRLDSVRLFERYGKGHSS